MVTKLHVSRSSKIVICVRVLGERTSHLIEFRFSKYLRFRLSLSLNGQMAIWRQNSRWITIWPFREQSVEQPNAIQLFDPLHPNLMNGNSATVLSSNCHSADQMQTEPEACRMHSNSQQIAHMCQFLK